MSTPLEVRVRPARPADDAALLELETASWTAESGFPSTIESISARAAFFSLDNPPEAHLVAELDGRIAGYVRLKPPTCLPENAHVVQVQGLAVHSSARRRGIATALLAASEQRAREQGARKLSLRVLSSNRSAIRLYERLGFEREGLLADEFLINGHYVDDHLMAKRL